MRIAKWVLLVFASAAAAQTVPPAADSIEAHLAAGKNAAGGGDGTPDFYGLVTAICVAPLNTPLPDAAPRLNPNRKAAYLEPRKLSMTSIGWARFPVRRGL